MDRRRRSRSPSTKKRTSDDGYEERRSKKSKHGRRYSRSRSRSRSGSNESRGRRRSRSVDKGRSSDRRREGRDRGRVESGSRSRSGSPDERSQFRRKRGRRDRSRSPRSGRRHRRYSRSPSQSSADSGNNSPDKYEESRTRREKEARQQAEEKRKQKEIMKALETPEEKLARRLRKKEEKERRRRERMGWDKQDLDYTNADNPFGDQHLLDKFVWHKKREISSGNDLPKEEIEKREKQKQEELRRELQKVKLRRLEREKEREAREEEMVLLQRLKEAEQFKEWEAQEDQFHLEQAKLRSRIRMESGRAKPIDLLAKYVNATEEDMDIEIQEPYLLLRGLNVVDLEDLLEDIHVYCTIEKDTNLEYWKDMTVVCEDELQKLKKLERTERGETGAERRGGINESVTSEVASVFKGKTHSQLIALEEQINSKIASAGSGTDVGYWESLLQQLKAHMARARLKDKHQALLRQKLFQLKQEQADQFGVSGTPLFPSAVTVKQEEEPENEAEQEEMGGGGRVRVRAADDQPGTSGTTRQVSGASAEESETLIAEEDLLEQAYTDYEQGKYSPKLFKSADVEEDLIVTAEEDTARRVANRERILSGKKTVDDYSEVEMVRKVGDDGIATEEYNFNSEVSLGDQDLVWKDKYRPRKPRFLNRVHTGFEWNKYNQTHYDTDNPPPKIVQGYKFNIFFPDLINKRKTPTYSLTPCDDNKDFALLRFHGGPPYEDIAFKIVNREWEYSWKHGFKSQFNNNIMQLWFRFKRNRYRR